MSCTNNIPTQSFPHSVVTAATGTSLMNGSSSPDLSVVSDLVTRATNSARPESPSASPSNSSSSPSTSTSTSPSTSASASTTTSVASESSPPSPAISTLPETTASPTPRRRGLLNSVRSRLFRQRTVSLPSPRSRSQERAEVLPNVADDTRTIRQEDFAPSTSSSSPATGSTPFVEVPRPSREQDHSEAIAGLRTHLTQQLTQALRNNVLGGGAMGERPLPPPAAGHTQRPVRATSSTAGPRMRDPSSVPLPADDPEDFPGPSPAAVDPDDVMPPLEPAMPHSSLPTGPPVSPQTIIGLSGETSMTFEDFLVDIQVDLRSTLSRRHEMDRAHREREEVAEVSDDSPSNAAASTSQPPNEPSQHESAAEREAADAARIRGRHLEHHVPSVSCVSQSCPSFGPMTYF